MGVRVKEFMQTCFSNALVAHAREESDYYDAENLRLNSAGYLQLAPLFYLQALTLNLTDIKAACHIYNEGSRFAFFGTKSGTTQISFYYPTNSAVTTQDTGITAALAGKYQRNLVYHAQSLYFITTAGVYTAIYNTTTNVFGAFTLIYTGNNANTLSIIRGNVYLTLATGEVQTLNTAGDGFDTLFTPDRSLNIELLSAFRGYILYVYTGADGTVNLCRLTTKLTTLTSIQGTGNYPPTSRLFHVHNNALMFSPGTQIQSFTRAADGSYSITNNGDLGIYAFDGSKIGLINNLYSPDEPLAYTGILAWRGQLLQYNSLESNRQKYDIYLLRPNYVFSLFIPLDLPPSTLGTFAPQIFCLADNLFALSAELNGGDTTFNVSHTIMTNRAASAVFTSSWQDMHSIHRPKRLHALGIVLSNTAANITVKIEYRVTTSWITAGTGLTGQHITVNNLDAEFYQLQIRYTLTNASLTHAATAIAAISAQYSEV